MELRILRRPAVEAITGLKKTRIDELERAGKFPQRIRISSRATGWYNTEVEEWVKSRPRASEVRPDPGGDVHQRRPVSQNAA